MQSNLEAFEGQIKSAFEQQHPLKLTVTKTTPTSKQEWEVVASKRVHKTGNGACALELNLDHVN